MAYVAIGGVESYRDCTQGQKIDLGSSYIKIHVRNRDFIIIYMLIHVSPPVIIRESILIDIR